MGNYTVYHLHDDTTNANGFADSCTKYTQYIKLAKEQNMKAIAFSNHGSIYDWIKKKQECDKNGIKYIHGVEAYLCKKFSDDDRGCHIGLYAKNWNGVLEINKLMSNATIKGVLEDNTDRHSYYNPRISLQELFNTSNNIIITTACLASPLNKWDKNSVEYKNLIEWLSSNKNRCFLEIQYHNSESQIEFNKELYYISKQYDIPLIAGTDTHSLNKYKAECRKILQKSKGCFYGEEDKFDLIWKSYDELVQVFKTQNSLPTEVYLQAIDNTNVLADMVESFTLDKAFKYPTLYGNNVRQQWLELINKNFKNKRDNGVLDLKNYTEQDYKVKILEEYKVMCKLGMESFMMFMSELLSWCAENNIPYGAGRGSVCGSMIAYITNITDVDALVWNTAFSRFCNEDRISLGDIDVDFAPEDREKVYKYIIERFTPEKTAYIAAFGTLQTRGCIDVLAKGLEYKDLDKVAKIKNQYDEYFDKYSKIVQEEINIEELVENGEIDSSSISFDYHNIYIKRINNKNSLNKFNQIKEEQDKLLVENQDLFYYLDGLKGTIVSKGSHPSGIIGSPISLSDNIGVFYKEGNINEPVSVCAMKSVDSLNYVKFDILGLKTVGVIKKACDYAGISYPKSHSMNWNDDKVWNNMIETKQGVFQFESDFSFGLLKDFKPHTINHMSMVNAALRPSGKSYRDRLIKNEFNSNPSKEIDELLKDNNGFLIFQEDTIQFLTNICGFTGSQADTTRRAIGKKDEELLKQQLPKILEGYCNHSSKPKEIAEEEAKQFIQIVQDSSEYQFGRNHSTAYSMNGYECTWLRTYYPLEFTASYLNYAENKDDTNNGVYLANHYGITIHPIKFGKSNAEYTIDKKNNTIYKGISSIKFCNSQIAEELKQLSQNNTYSNFIELLKDITFNTTVNNRQLKILTGLNFFSDFGNNKYLLDCIEQFEIFYKNKKSIKQINKNKIESFGLNEYIIKKYSNKETDSSFKDLDIDGLLEYKLSNIPNKCMSIIEQIKFEKEYLEYIEYKNEKVNDNYYVVVEFKTYNDKSKPYLTLRQISTGEEIKTKVKNKKLFTQYPFKEYSALKLNSSSFETQFKSKLVNGVWGKTDKTEDILVDYEIIK